jgi:hypothetical protein
MSSSRAKGLTGMLVGRHTNSSHLQKMTVNFTYVRFGFLTAVMMKFANPWMCFLVV